MKNSWQISSAIFMLVLLAACSQDVEQTEAAAVAMGAIPVTQLPNDVRPLSYKLRLKINPDLESFEGRVEIEIELDKARNGIWLHGNKLTFSDTTLLRDGKALWKLEPKQVDSAGVLKIDFPDTLQPGVATLIFNYSAAFDKTSEGLYKIVESENAYIFSQFESTSARLAFPSFDEPGFKTAFDIEVITRSDVSAVSNGPEKRVEELDGGLKRITFATTKVLPTYLIAFAVGPFDIVEGADIKASKNRDTIIPLRGVAVKGKGEKLEYALAHTEEIVLALETYFDYPYPYEKLDLIAVPPMGNSAMENAGAITYGEQLLFLDENSTVEQIRGFYNVHAHELAHQWFGNLVTPKWWNDIWLNEAFATWMANTILDRLFPDEHYLDDQAANTAAVMTQDSLVSARKIRQPIVNHGDIRAAFDGITYTKGGGVLRMFESFMGEDAFRKGIRHYMDKHAWGNTDANDFMQAISEVNDTVDPAELMRSFNSYIDQPGVPIVNVDLSCGDGKNSLTITQKRYFPIGSLGASEQSWDIPICVKYSVGGELKETCDMVTEASQDMALPTESCPDYIVPNAGGNAYYRWNLSSDQWQALLKNFEDLESNEQLSAASSLSAAFNSAELDLGAYLDAVALLSRAKAGNVATAPIGDVLTVVQYLAEGEQLKTLQATLVESYGPRLDAIDAITEKTAEQQQTYNYLLSVVSRFLRDETWRAKLTQSALAYTGYDSDQKLHPELIDINQRSNALRVASDDLGLPFVKHLWSHVKASDDSALREVMIRAISFSGDPAAANFARKLMLDPDLRQEEIGYVGFHQSYYKANREALWTHVQTNYDALVERVGENNKGRLVGVFSSFCSEKSAKELDAFFAHRVDTKDGSDRTLAGSLETIRLCAAFVDAHKL
ncbi:MAG: alanyl aminopeptidase [Flavobacterium sp.]|jgi:alanyl aminopeptidase